MPESQIIFTDKQAKIIVIDIPHHRKWAQRAEICRPEIPKPKPHNRQSDGCI